MIQSYISERNDMSFYVMAESCQIPDLAGLYEKYFGQSETGVFVEVGAYNGYDFSNTWGLAEKRWSGVCYEPVVRYYTDCVIFHENHSNMHIVNAAVGCYDGEVDLYEGGVDSTIDIETAIKSPFGFVYDITNKIVCRQVRLDTDLPKHGILPGFDVISIDVEGAELQVLDGFDIKHWLPRMIIIETHVGITGKDYHAKAIIDHILGCNYDIIGGDALNTIFWCLTHDKQV